MEQACPGCGRTLWIRDDLVGSSGVCKACGTRFVAGNFTCDPNVTIQIRRRALWPWILVSALSLLIAAGATFVAFNHTRLNEVSESRAEAETSPVAQRPSVVLEPIAEQPSGYAMELAIYQTQAIDPPEDLVQEFNVLLAKAKEQYTRSSDMQIRDAIYQITGLREYGHPEINPLLAARMLVDWMPPSVAIVGAGVTQSSVSGGPTTHTQSVSAGTIAVGNLSVATAVESISNEIYQEYDDYVAAQWEAYYARQDAQMAEIERREAVRQAQLQAQEQARIARDQAIMEHQRWLQSNSITGQLAGRR